MDGRALYDGNRHRGLGIYLWSLLSELGQLSTRQVGALVTPGTPLPDGIEPATVQRWQPGRLSDVEHEYRLPRDLLTARAPLFHSPAIQPPRRSPVPWIQTLHDLIPLTFDHPWFERDRGRWQRRLSRLREAVAVVAVSQYTADQAVQILKLDPGRVHVAQNGVGGAFAPPASRHRADPPYILYVGVYGPHKGYPEAFELVARLALMGFPHRLKVVGSLAVWWNDLEVRRLLSLATAPERVELLGSVEEAELLRLYQQASLLVVTSRQEGFGLPAVEAMACGTPVVAFSNSSITEVVDGGGVLVPDGDVEAMAEAVASLLSDDATWQQWSARAKERAPRFTWRAAANAYARVYEEALAA